MSKWTYLGHNMKRWTFFVKPDEQCRTCSNMVMVRKERLAPSTYDEGKVKRTSLCLLCSYVKKDLFRSTLNLLSEPSTYVLVSKRTYLGHNTKCWTITPFTYPLVYPSTRQLANLPKPVNFSAKILTLWVPFLSTNRPPRRKKSILARVCFDAKRG